MILRNQSSEPAKAAAAEGFVDVDALSLSSVDLWERHGAKLEPFGLRDLSEAVEALTDTLEGSLSRKQIAGLLEELETPFPCYFGAQGTGADEPTPFLTDGTRCRWSVFFESGEGVTIVVREGDRFIVTQHPAEEPPRSRIGRLRQFLSRPRRGGHAPAV